MKRSQLQLHFSSSSKNASWDDVIISELAIVQRCAAVSAGRSLMKRPKAPLDATINESKVSNVPSACTDIEHLSLLSGKK
mmetsp:Transcript_12602/g.26816  ORF Transcript_12602/g.26816 Transcript_12602/m.26816 type:complete len:80 (+) Transcript_12602:149-388(+)